MDKLTIDEAVARVCEELLGWERTTWEVFCPSRAKIEGPNSYLLVDPLEQRGVSLNEFGLHGPNPYTWEFFGPCLEAIRERHMHRLFRDAMYWLHRDDVEPLASWDYYNDPLEAWLYMTPEIGFRAVCMILDIEVVE